MLKGILDSTSGLLSLLAASLLLYYRAATEGIYVASALAMGYLVAALLSRRPIYLYPASLFLSASYLLAIRPMGDYNTYLLLSFPLLLGFYGLGYYFKGRFIQDYSTPLHLAGHVTTAFLVSLITYHQAFVTSHGMVALSLAVYATLYLLFMKAHKEKWYLLPSLLLFSLAYFFVLPLIPVALEIRPVYYVAISALYVLMGKGIEGMWGAEGARPAYGAALVISLATSAIVLIKGDPYAGIGVFLISALVYGLMVFLFRREEFIYLVTLSLGFLAYNFLQISGDRFSRSLVNYYLYGLIILGLVFLYPFAREAFRFGRPFSLFIVRNWKGVMVFSLPLLALVPLVVLSYTMEVTANPYFCGSCHNMKPQYEAWKRSSHKEIGCVTCHYPPGLEPLVRGKVEGLVDVVKYFSGQYSEPHAEVSDRACLRGGCHSQEVLYKRLTYKGKVKYDHRIHLAKEVRGIGLRCSTCHTHIQEGEHFRVAEGVCFTCHLGKRGEKETGVGSCLTCHDVPARTIEGQYGRYNHLEFFQGREVPCSYCHAEVTQGGGEVVPEKCLSCHGEMAKFNEPRLLHERHVSTPKVRKVECFECHSSVAHGIRRKTEGFSPGCGSCHSGQHQAPEKVYAGIGGTRVRLIPSPMFAANVDCNACHRFGLAKGTGPVPGRIMKARKEACDNCHGKDKGYSGIVEVWQGDTREGMARVESLFKKVEERLAIARGPEGAKVKGLYERAKLNYGLAVSDGSLGVHNYSYVEELLKKAREDLEEALRVMAASRDNKEAIR